MSFFRPIGSSVIKPISKADESRKGDKGGTNNEIDAEEIKIKANLAKKGKRKILQEEQKLENKRYQK